MDLLVGAVDLLVDAGEVGVNRSRYPFFLNLFFLPQSFFFHATQLDIISMADQQLT